MTSELVQIRCKSLRSKSSYGAFDDADEEMLELTGSTSHILVPKNHGKGRTRRTLCASFCLQRGSGLLGTLRMRPAFKVQMPILATSTPNR